MSEDDRVIERDELLAKFRDSGRFSEPPEIISGDLAAELTELAYVINSGGKLGPSDLDKIGKLTDLHRVVIRSLSSLAVRNDSAGNDALDHLISCFTETIASMHLLHLDRLRQRAKKRYSFPFIVSPHRSGLDWLKSRITDLQLSSEIKSGTMASTSKRDTFAGVAWGLLSSFRISGEHFANWDRAQRKDKVKTCTNNLLDLYPDLKVLLLKEVHSDPGNQDSNRKLTRVHEAIFERFETLLGNNRS